VEQNNLPQRVVRLVFVGHDGDFGCHMVFHAPGREAIFVYLTTPVVASDGGDMRVMKERRKIRGQLSI